MKRAPHVLVKIIKQLLNYKYNYVWFRMIGVFKVLDG